MVRYGQTWWGKQWLNALSDIDYDNRLPRGKTYANKGAVETLKIKDNRIEAKVRGSQKRPYGVTIIAPPFEPKMEDRLVDEISKNPVLIAKLLNINDNHEKTIIFTQFTGMAELLLRFIREKFGHEPLYLHGAQSRAQRDAMVQRFQHDPQDRFFILSLKAGGTGLNLTAAQNVVHYDLWWNPAVEAQATDRAYRIGQRKNVMVHRFITQGTFEERIDDMIQSKKELANMSVASGESWIGNMSNKELKDVFGL